MKRQLILLMLIVASAQLHAQGQTTRYWVFLNETQTHIGEPCLGERAMERRLRQNIPLRATDYRLDSQAVSAVAATGVQIRRQSRWLRAVSVEATSEQLARLTHLPQVARLDRMRPMRLMDTQGYSYGLSLAQTNQINLAPVHDAGYTGLGQLIAVMDAGYYEMATQSAFASLYTQGRIALTQDFVDGDTNVFHGSYHGTAVLSTMCADLDGNMVGTAPEADYLLFRTEDVSSETLAEEDNWVVAAEWADSLGADLINTSLGYSVFDGGVGNHSYADMDGRTTPISLAAVAAARTGIIVVVSAGNEGMSSWRHITAPGDADSILTIGAVDSVGLRAGFSSQGPSSDGRIKPDICARGVAATVMITGSQVGSANGTSFSSPITCGAMASLLQAVKTNQNTYDIQDVMQWVRESGSQAHKPDTLQGWGIPNFGDVLASLGLIEIPEGGNWQIRSSADAQILTRIAPTGWADIERIDVTGRVIARYSMLPGTSDLPILPMQQVTFLRVAGDGWVEVLKVPAL